MVDLPRPIWWRATDGPPPTAWVDVFAEFTGERSADEWGLAVAIIVARTRRRTGAGPTFSEVFRELLPDTDGLPSLLPTSLEPKQRRQLIRDFRLHCAIEWKRRGWIAWRTGVTRSLRVGRTFRARSRQHRELDRASASDGTHCSALRSDGEASLASLKPRCRARSNDGPQVKRRNESKGRTHMYLLTLTDQSPAGKYYVITHTKSAYEVIVDPDAQPRITRYRVGDNSNLLGAEPLTGVSTFSFDALTGDGIVWWWKERSEDRDVPDGAYAGSFRRTSRVQVVLRDDSARASIAPPGPPATWPGVIVHRIADGREGSLLDLIRLIVGDADGSALTDFIDTVIDGRAGSEHADGD